MSFAADDRGAEALRRGLATIAPAKVNATLVVGPVRPADGRHELVSVMQSVSLVDDVTLRARDERDAGVPAGTDHGDGIRCAGVEGDNLALRALAAFRALTGWDAPPLIVEITKRIPVAAGMAGGSADAGAVLRLASAASGLATDEQLHALAADLGADVAHQLRPGLALATGAGERLRRFDGVLDGALVVVIADQALSTPAVYRRADELRSPCSAATLEAWHYEIETSLTDPAGASVPAALAVNDLQDAAVDLAPGLGATVDAIEGTGADRAMVCGSGPTAIGWFATASAADRAAEALRSGGYDVRVVVPTDTAPIDLLPQRP
jgi:4-diphosphocytidyl-2-C-methyl-D-erythritol kinase